MDCKRTGITRVKWSLSKVSPPCPVNTIRIDTIKATAAKYPGMEILDSQPGMCNQEKSLAVMENYLQKYPQIGAIYTADDNMVKGAFQAYKKSERSDIKIFLVGGASTDSRLADYKMTSVHFFDDLLLFKIASTKAIPVIPSSIPGKSHPLIPPEHEG